MMKNRKVYFRHLMFFYYRKSKNAVETKKKICMVYRNDAIGKSTVHKRSLHLKTGNFCLEDIKCSGQSLVIKNDEVKTLIESNPRYPT